MRPQNEITARRITACKNACIRRELIDAVQSRPSNPSGRIFSVRLRRDPAPTSRGSSRGRAAPRSPRCGLIVRVSGVIGKIIRIQASPEHCNADKIDVIEMKGRLASHIQGADPRLPNQFGILRFQRLRRLTVRIATTDGGSAGMIAGGGSIDFAMGPPVKSSLIMNRSGPVGPNGLGERH